MIKGQKATIINIRNELESRRESIYFYLGQMGKTDSVGNLMHGKEMLLKSWIHLPLGENHCIYCVASYTPKSHETDCFDCEYGKKNGICKGAVSENSSYEKVMNAQLKLASRLSLYSVEDTREIESVIRTQIIDRLEHYIKQVQESTDRYILCLKKAKSKEEFLEIKSRMMIDMVVNIPIGIDTCYYCEETNWCCVDCAYARAKGRACNDSPYDFDLIVDARIKLVDVIREEYPLKP